VIAKISKGRNVTRLLYYLYGPGKSDVLWDFQNRSVMLQLLTASLLNIGSRAV
jgi:hypothetical protein